MTALEQRVRELQDLGVSGALAARIERYIREHEPPSLVKISPFRLAGEWQTPLRPTLDAFLLGTRLGMFNLEWDIRCPSCKGSTQLTDRLSRLKSRSHCHYCQLEIDGGFDDAVEVTFRVNHAVRPYPEPDFMDVVAARNVMEDPQPFAAPAGEESAFQVSLVPGTYHLFSPDMSVSAPLRVGGLPVADQAVRFAYDGESFWPDRTDVAPGPTRVSVDNRGAAPLVLAFARAREFPFVSGAVLACHPDFRDLFSAELIHPDETFAIQSLAFLFTDIRGSTEMYERLGDSRAYALVRDHFTIIGELVGAHDGAIVKTIGDAVMATFTRPDAAMEAVLGMHEAFAHFNHQDLERDDVVIKVGVHHGPCIAVTSNERLDYFGRTVNIAARVQGLSVGEDVVMSRSFAEEPAVRGLLEAAGWSREAFRANLKGIADAYEVVRVRP